MQWEKGRCSTCRSKRATHVPERRHTVPNMCYTVTFAVSACLQVYKALLDGVQAMAVKEVHLGDSPDVHAAFMRVRCLGLLHEET
jgi:hypothetical protein